jgi:hypothetical protein
LVEDPSRIYCIHFQWRNSKQNEERKSGDTETREGKNLSDGQRGELEQIGKGSGTEAAVPGG